MLRNNAYIYYIMCMSSVNLYLLHNNYAWLNLFRSMSTSITKHVEFLYLLHNVSSPYLLNNVHV